MTQRSLVFALLALPSVCGLLAAQEAQPARPATPNAKAARIVSAPPQTSEPTQAELQKKFDEKLAKPFLKAAKWTTDYDAARASAKEGHKLILTYFTRSYAY